MHDNTKDTVAAELISILSTLGENDQLEEITITLRGELKKNLKSLLMNLGFKEVTILTRTYGA